MSASNAGDPGSIPAGKIPWRRKWQPTPVFLPGESHGRGSLVGYSPRGRKESDTTERLHFHFHFHEDLQDLLELTPQKDVLFIIGDWNAKEEVKRYLE